MHRMLSWMVSVYVLVASIAGAGTVDWPCWRGANHDGITTESGWKIWTGAPKQLWQAKVGQGYSSMAVVGGKVYTMGNDDGQDTVRCLNADSGKEEWKHSYACGSDKQYPGPRGTPAVDGNFVYTLSRAGHVFCLDAGKGTVVWSKDPKALKPGKITWGISASPLVSGDKVFVLAGGAGSGILSFNKTNGQDAWRGSQGPISYATPVPITLKGKGVLLYFGTTGLEGVDAGSGANLFQYPWKTQYDVHAADPIFHEGKVFISSGYGTGCALVDVSGDAAKEVYKNKNMSNHTNGCVLYKGFLFGNNGASGKGDLVCLNFQTGEVAWKQKGFTPAPIVADGKLVMMLASGDLVVAEASGTAYKELARGKVLSGQCWTSPVLSGGRIYCRNTGGDLVCVDVR